MKKDIIKILENEQRIHLNDQQKSAALHGDGPAVILAVPGAGKTTVVVTRTANLIMNHGVKPESILTLTFSKAAAMDMQSRFKHFFGRYIDSEVKFSTIHSFSYFVLREYAGMLNKRYTLIEGEKAKISKNSILKKIYYNLNNSYINEDKLEELSSSISFVKNMMLDMEGIANFKCDFSNFDVIFKQYEQIKKDNNFIDYDDMLSMCHRILSERKEILQKYRNRFNYLQVDEGQDTSKIQYEIIKLVSAPRNNIFLVGDEDQSIYGFRGAYPEAVLRFEEDYQDARVFFIEENYRSTSNIVEISNEFIKSNTQRHNKNIFTRNKKGAAILVRVLRNETEEIDFIVEKLKKASRLSDEAVIFRNNISMIPIADALDKNHILFYIRDFRPVFFKHWVANDIISFLSFSLWQDNMDAFEKIYYKTDCFIPKKAVEYSKNNFKENSMLGVLKTYPELNSYQRNRIDILEQNFNSLSVKTPKNAINYIENNLKYKDYLKDNSQKLGYSYESSMSIIGIMKMIAHGINSIEGFLNRFEELKVIMENARFNRYENAVALSTVHGCKGLEFDSVTMMDLIEGQFPTPGSIQAFEAKDIREMEEERRLFYVGMTRARNNLALISVNSKNNENVICSRFVGEVYSITNPT